MTMDTSRITCNCQVHGEYQKYKYLPDRSCPYCEKDNAVPEAVKLLKSQPEVLRTQTEVLNSRTEVLKTVVKSVQCVEHGVTEIVMPVLLGDIEPSCKLCAEKSKADLLQPGIEKIIAEEFKHAGIPLNSIGTRFSNVDKGKSPKQQFIIERLISYVLDMLAVQSSKGAKNIVLTGNMGTGKTLWASVLLQNIISRSVLHSGVTDAADLRLMPGLRAQFISETQLTGLITDTWRKDSAESGRGLIQRLSTKPILCLDDVGCSVNTLSQLTDLYFSVLDERYKRKLPTIITTNLPHDQLKLAISARAADRFLESTNVIVMNFDWIGYRTSSAQDMEVF